MHLVHSEYDKDTGITEEIWFHEGVGGENDKITIRRLQDVDHILKVNSQQFNEHTSKKACFRDSDGLHQVARIPMILIEQWKREKGIDWFHCSDKDKKRILNDNSFSKLRTRPGKL